MTATIKRRLVFAIAAAAAAVTALATFLVMSPTSQAQVQTGVWYQIQSRHSGLYFDIEGARTTTGTQLLQWNQTGANNQQFRFIDAGGGYYRIQARHSNLVLEVYEWNANNGATIAQWTDLNGTNQQWQVQQSGEFYTFVNRFSGKALDVWERSTAPGGRISQYTANGGTNQQFRLVPVGGGGDPGPGNPGQCGSGTPNATVTGSSGNYTARNGNNTVYQGGDYRAAIQAAIDSTGNNGRIAVMASGSIGGNTISIPSNRIFEGCGTINVGNRSGRGAVESLNTTNVRIPYLSMTGNPYFGMRFYGNRDLHLGQINLNLSGGIGIRFERDHPGSSNVRMDNVYVAGAGNHGVETWNIDGLTIGTITARNTAYSGLLLNNTRNANIGTVDGQGTGTNTGYATFRTANTNGRLSNGSYSTNIRVDRVVSRGGGRGIFCVSQSGGLHIGTVDLANNGNNSILIENCYNVTIAGGTVNGGGEVRLAARSEFANNRDITITLRVDNTSVRENPCGINVRWNLSGNGSRNIC
jgi:hypothetical protein